MTTPLLRFYGRRKGRPLNAARQAAFDKLDAYKVTLPADGPLEPATLFCHPERSRAAAKSKDLTPLAMGSLDSGLRPSLGMTGYALEIGFGGGEHLAAQALAHPDIGFIGAEPFMNGISSCIQHVETNGSTNVRIWPDDARLLLDALAPASLQTIYLLFNDPWPKARHADRRFVSPANLERLARVLAPGGTLRIATDDPGLQAWTAEHMATQTFFTPAPGLYKERPDWPHTRYESKAIKAGRHCMYWEYARLAEPLAQA